VPTILWVVTGVGWQGFIQDFWLGERERGREGEGERGGGSFVQQSYSIPD